ncbi:hypothetical protein [Iodobacter violaceini]|nr:hypothetical protein [Iodobacter violacea]
MIAVFQHRSTVDCTYLISFVPFVSVKGKFIMKKSLLVAALIAVALSACGKKDEAPVEAASAVVEAASAPAVEAASAVVEAAPVASEAAASEASAAK